MEKIYLVTVLQKMDIDSQGWLDVGCIRTMGWYSDRDTAIEAVECNACDINEFLFGYAVIEEYREGMYPLAQNEIFFKFNDSKGIYERIDVPKEVKHFKNLGLII